MLEDMIKEKVAMTFTWKPNAQAVHGSKTSSHPNYKPGSYKETGSNLYFVALYRWNKKGGSLGDKLVWISFKDEPASDSEAGSKAVLEALIAELNVRIKIHTNMFLC